MNSLSNNRNLNHRTSFWTVVLITCFISFIRIGDSRWTHGGNAGDTQISFDVFGYYLYLPSTIIYQDFSNLEYLRSILPDYKPTTDFSQATEGPIGKYVFKYTMGQSLMFAPFFLTAHYLVVPLTDFKRDGFSPPYQLLIALGCLFYTLIGILYLRKFLNLYFDDRITAIIIILIVFATNFLLYATRENTMPHNQLFALFAMIFYFSAGFYKKPSFKNALLIGACIGLCGLVRPTEVIICIIPVFLGVRSMPELVYRIKNYWKFIAVMAAMACFVFSFQLIYWKIQSGNWFFYSYGNESLNFMNPHFKDVLFSFRKGLFVYTPIMIFVVAGIVLMFKRMKENALAVLIFAILNLVIVSSWDCWWYGGSFGQRSMVQFYMVAALPLGVVINSIFQNKSIVMKGLFGFVLSLFVALNVFQVWQYKKGIIHYESMTKEAYFAVFGKFKSPENFNALLKEPDYSHYRTPKNVTYIEQLLVNENYESGYISNAGIEGSGGFKSDKVAQFSPTYTFPVKSLVQPPEVKVRCSFQAFSTKDIVNSKLIMTVETEGKPAYIYKSLDLSLLKLTNNEWHPLEMWMDVPKYVGVDDVIKVYIWNQQDDELFIDNFQILLLKKKFIL